MKKRITTVLLALCLVSWLAGCAGGELVDERSEQEKRQDSFGKLFGDDLLVFGARRDTQDETTLVATPDASVSQVSSYLWIATLDVVDFMPLLQADRTSGIILTDWYRRADNASERFKIDAKILSRTLRSDGIRVRVFKQSLQDNLWVDAVVPAEISRSVEDVILNRARLLKASSE